MSGVGAVLGAAALSLLLAAHRFRLTAGTDYYSTRLLGHFLLHCGCGLKVAQVLRDGRIGVVVGKIAVDLAEQLGDRAAESAKQRWRVGAASCASDRFGSGSPCGSPFSWPARGAA